MRAKPLDTRDLILSLSKDEAKISCSFSSLLRKVHWRRDIPDGSPRFVIPAKRSESRDPKNGDTSIRYGPG
jgi:hypothetical protein